MIYLDDGASPSYTGSEHRACGGQSLQFADGERCI